MAARVDSVENDSEIHKDPLHLLSVVIPAYNEEGCIASTVKHLHLELRLQNVPHQIVVVDDESTAAAPLPIYLPLYLAGKVFQPRRLQKSSE